MNLDSLFRKNLDHFLYPKPENFLKNNRSALKKLRNALKKIGFKFKGRFIVDLRLPNFIGGYFSRKNSEDTVAINPLLLLYGSEKDIAHVLYHEGLHAGLYTSGIRVDDESFVEAMTKKKIAEIYGGEKVTSGYDTLVNDFNQYFGSMSFNELKDLIETGDEDTFDNLLEVIVVNQSVNLDDFRSLSFEEILKKLKGVWGTLQKLFPRMMNKIAGNNYDPHVETKVELYHFKFDSLLNKTAKKIINENLEIFENVFEKIFEQDRNYSKKQIIDELFRLGLGYIYDFDPALINTMIDEFLSKRNFYINPSIFIFS